MKTIDTILKNKIRTLSGSVLGICIKESLIMELEKNNSINRCDILSTSNNKEEKGKGKLKQFNIKKLRKRYRHKRLDAIVAELDSIHKYEKTFIRDSIYITKGDLYFYTNNKEYDLGLFQKKYKRFLTSFEVIEVADGYFITIHVNNTKNKIIFEKIYYMIDVINDAIDFIGDVLVS